MDGDVAAWSHTIVLEADGTYRLEIIDEDGALWPVARQVSRAQAEQLVGRIGRQAQATGQPIKAVIRDPYFMAAAVITVKRLRG